MKQILWFRRDLRIEDNAILSNSTNEVLPIFIFDINILNKLSKDDKRVTFIYQTLLNLQNRLKKIDLDLYIFYGDPLDILKKLVNTYNINEILSSCDFDEYSIKRDTEISSIIKMNKFYDSFILHPNDGLKKDNTPYKVFTPFYKSQDYIHSSSEIKEYKIQNNLKLIKLDNHKNILLDDMKFIKQKLPDFLYKSININLKDFISKLEKYSINRDFFNINATSQLSIYLRFGLISPRQIFNIIKKLNIEYKYKESYIRQLFWREFYTYLLYHFPKSEFENFNNLKIDYSNNIEHFKKWCEGNTGIPIIDASMQYLNKTGLMHNRLRMIVSSFLTKNLFINWKLGEKYFASKLLDYEASSNIGSWQWAASTGADSVPYFRVFNPYTQSKKFDKDAIFIKSVIKKLENIDPKLIHKEYGLKDNLFINYPKPIVDISISRNLAIQTFKNAKN